MLVGLVAGLVAGLNACWPRCWYWYHTPVSQNHYFVIDSVGFGTNLSFFSVDFGTSLSFSQSTLAPASAFLSRLWR